MVQRQFKSGFMIALVVCLSAAAGLAAPGFLDQAGSADGARALGIAVEGVEVWRLGLFEHAATGKKSIRFGIFNGSPATIRRYTQYVVLKQAGRVVCTVKNTVKGIAPGRELVFDVFLACGKSYDGIDYGYELKSDLSESQRRP